MLSLFFYDLDRIVGFGRNHRCFTHERQGNELGINLKSLLVPSRPAESRFDGG